MNFNEIDLDEDEKITRDEVSSYFSKLAAMSKDKVSDDLEQRAKDRQSLVDDIFEERGQ